MVKGFKKDGRFHPTESRTKSSLKKSSLEKPDWVNPEIVKQHKEWLKHKDEQERNKGSFDEQKEDALKKVKAKGLVITERHEEATEKDEEEFDYYEVEIGEKETLDAVDGKSTALEMMDKITGISEDERLRYDITLDNKLAELQDAGKIEVEAGTNIWKRVM